MRLPRVLIAVGLPLFLVGTRPSVAQERDTSLAALAVRLASVTAVTGYERAMVDTVLRLLPGAVLDRAGNARLQLGGRSAKRLVVCPLDEPGYVVGSVREDGYLTLRRVSGQVAPLFDQQLEGHRVTIQGRGGPVPGVVAVRSIHLTRGREAPSEAAFTVDDALVDVGASSRPEVIALGVGVLAPVTLAKLPHRYGEGLLAAPMAGRRAACAALLLAVQQARVRAKLIPPVIVAFVVEQQLAERGLGTLANALGPFDETLIVDGRPGTPGSLQRGSEADTSRSGVRQLIPRAGWRGLGSVLRWSLPVSYADTPVETVSLRDVESLRDMLARWVGGDQ
jgi:putative aminopeptidase FrvX